MCMGFHPFLALFAGEIVYPNLQSFVCRRRPSVVDVIEFCKNTKLAWATTLALKLMINTPFNLRELTVKLFSNNLTNNSFGLSSQSADCRPGVKWRLQTRPGEMQTEGNMQTAVIWQTVTWAIFDYGKHTIMVKTRCQEPITNSLRLP